MLEETGAYYDDDESRYIEAARRGDLPSFNWLVLRYQTRVYNLCYRMLSDPDAAADAARREQAWRSGHQRPLYDMARGAI